MRFTASTTTCVLTVYGSNTIVNVDTAPTTISGEEVDRLPSRNDGVYDAFACANLVYMPNVAPELSACVFVPTLTLYTTVTATIALKTLGDSVGDDVGLSVGAVVGEVVGDSVGDVVGDVVGVSVGDVVGDTVGGAVGDSVGEPVGEAVGECVGDVLGEAVGDVVGETVGIWVGDAVGDNVGVSVGLVVGDVVGDIVGDDVVGEVVGDNVGDVVGVIVGELVGDGFERELRVGLSIGTTQMAHEHDRRAVIEGVLDGRERGHDALIVGNFGGGFVLRDIKINADKHAFADEIEITNGFKGRHVSEVVSSG